MSTTSAGFLSPRRLAAVLVTVLLGACATAPTSQAPRDNPAAHLAPTIERLDGPALAALLSEPSGHRRVFNFWATWCGPCLSELPELSAFADAHGDVELILVNVDERALQRHRAPGIAAARGVGHLRHVGLYVRYPVDELNRQLPDWPNSLPVTMIVREDGTLARRLIGATSARRLAQAVATAM